MPATNGYLGKLMLLKLGDGGGTEIFTSIGGVKTTEFSATQTTVDTTTKDSGTYTEEMATFRSVTMSGSGLHKNETQQRALATWFFQATPGPKNLQLVCGNGDTFQGSFFLTEYKRTGPHDNPEEFSISLKSTGSVTFTPGAA